MDLRTRLPRGRMIRLTTQPDPVARRSPLLAVGSMATGALVSYLLDPRLGRRRRHVLRDKVRHHVRGIASQGSTVRRRMQGRRQRWMHRAGGITGSPALELCVREEISRVASHPEAIRIQARDGRVTIDGPVLREEVDAVRAAVGSCPDVDFVEDRLEIQEDDEGLARIEAVARSRSNQMAGRHHPTRLGGSVDVVRRRRPRR